MPETDPAARAAERICSYFNLCSSYPEQVIRGEYALETAMQARAEHLEAVLAKVREGCERTPGASPKFDIDGYGEGRAELRDRILAIISGAAVGESN